MKRMKRRGDVGGSGGLENESDGIVLDVLEIGKKMLRTGEQ